MQSKTTAKDFFLYLGVLIGLYVSTISFLMLTFSIIDKVLPLANEYVGGFDSSIRSALAILIIFFVAFLYLSVLAYKDLKASPEKKEIWVRKWMIFFTLFVAGLTIAIDLAVLIYRFLGAEDLSVRFFLKVFFVLGTAITIFRFYFYELKREASEYKKIMKSVVILVTTIVFATIVYGIVLIGSPAMQRAKMLDDQRVNDLVSIQSQIVYTEWQSKGTVPATLDVLKNPINGYVVPTDPETGAGYGYKIITKNSFQLCADFKTTNNTPSTDIRMLKPVSMNGIDENWQHEATTTCFVRTIDPTLYKVTPSVK